MQCTLNGIVKHDVLFSQFQQHGVIKELVNGDILTEALYEGRGGEEAWKGMGGVEERGGEGREEEG